MATIIQKMSIALPPEMVALVREAVETGEYASNSEVVRDALRDWTYKRAIQKQGISEIRRAWQEAIDDTSPGIPAEEVMERLSRKYHSLAEHAQLSK